MGVLLSLPLRVQVPKRDVGFQNKITIPTAEAPWTSNARRFGPFGYEIGEANFLDSYENCPFLLEYPSRSGNSRRQASTG